MLIGYARKSTVEQNLDSQIDALKKVGCEKIFEDIASGSLKNRKVLEETLSYLRSGDTLVVYKLDRLGRSVKNLIELINKLQQKKIEFRSLTEAINTSTPAGQFFFHISAAFAELERNLIRERTQAGLKAARVRGRKGGRPKAIDKETFEIALQLYNDGKMPVGTICKRLSIAKRTFYRYLEARKESMQIK